MPARDLYEVLQVHHSAELKVIQTAYRRLAKIYHPDVNPDPAAGPHMKEINLAYELLSDPVRRVQYDRGRGVPAGSTDRPTQRKRKPARTDASPPFRSRPERSSYRRGWDPWPHVFSHLFGPLGLFVAIKVCLLLSIVASHTPASARQWRVSGARAQDETLSKDNIPSCARGHVSTKAQGSADGGAPQGRPSLGR